MNSRLRPILLLSVVVLLSGCAGIFPTRRCQRSSSVADYLFPRQQQIVEPTMPVLHLPLRVGVAFVPSVNSHADDFSELQKQQLLDKVAEQFRNEKIVETVQVIPASFLRAEGSFDNLDQVKRMMGIDVVVLLSYDQLQFTSTNLLSLSYWTIVGAYTVHGNKNDTHTLVEAVVYDIGSRGLLFRAAGGNQTRHGSTGMELEEYQRRDAGKSLELATEDLSKNLSAELQSFKARVKEGRAGVRVENREGYSGMGSADISLVALLLSAASVAVWRRRAGARVVAA